MTQKKKGAEASASLETTPEAAKLRVGQTGRNDVCPCGSGKKYKKCHLQQDEAAASPPAGPPEPQEHIDNGWRLFEQRRPGAAEKEFRKALELKPELPEALVGIGMARLQTGDNDGARKELSAVIKLSEPLAADLAKQGVKDASPAGKRRPISGPPTRWAACPTIRKSTTRPWPRSNGSIRST